MADKYLYNNGGVWTERELTVTSAGAGDAGKGVALDGSGKLDTTLLPTGVGPETTTIEASEHLAAGDLVNIHDSSGAKVRKADANNSRIAHGFVLSSVTSGQNATVYTEGMITGLTSLSIGARYFLSTTAGAVTTTAPSSSGDIVQPVGIAVSATALSFSLQPHVVLA